jgi:hydroxymethylpyrimidine kinase/phosphomethylpyrimidine kinase/thiamine-phosphate diphosphorylase
MIKLPAKQSPKKQKPILWTISGADCSGGAGIAADIKTGHSLGVEVCHLITANTVQNSTKLLSINPTDVKILTEQAKALCIDKAPTAIKIGLIATTEQIDWLVSLLSELKQRMVNLIIVYDPVGQASVGGRLANFPPDALLPLIPLLSVMTPNRLEAKQLNKLTDNVTASDSIAISKNLINLGCDAVIVKGGHQDSTSETRCAKNTKHCIDTCVQKSPSNKLQSFQLQSPYIDTSHSHGGGCSFASALACFLAHNYLLRDAFTLTKAYINQGLKLAQQEQQTKSQTSMNTSIDDNYYGAFEQSFWPSVPDTFPTVTGAFSHKHRHLPAFTGLELNSNERLGLYPVIDSIEWLARLLPLNLKIIQLRIKNKSDKELDNIVEKAVTLAKNYQCRLFINDHWKLAIKHGAYGVHIGQEDLARTDLSAIAKAGLRLGISTHGCYEFLLAKQLQPSYLAIGAIFPTKTKDMTGQIQGLNNLIQLLVLANNTPVVAIGGINQQRVKQVWDTGVSSVAVVTAITEAEQPIIATKSMQALLC